MLRFTCLLAISCSALWWVGSVMVVGLIGLDLNMLVARLLYPLSTYVFVCVYGCVGGLRSKLAVVRGTSERSRLGYLPPPNRSGGVSSAAMFGISLASSTYEFSWAWSTSEGSAPPTHECLPLLTPGFLPVSVSLYLVGSTPGFFLAVSCERQS